MRSTDTLHWPPSRRADVVETLHGTVVHDPYRWLEAGDDAEVVAWTAAQDRYARAELAKLPDVAATETALRPLFYRDAVGVPVVRGGRYFFTRQHATSDQAVVVWTDGEHGAEHVLIDPAAWSADGSRALGEWAPSDDGAFVAYNVTADNADTAVMHVVDVATGADRADTISGTDLFGVAWSPDGAGFYYSWLPPAGTVADADRNGASEVRFHRLGDDAAHDAILYPATGRPGTFALPQISTDGHWLIVTVLVGWTAADIYYRDARDPKAAWQTLVAGAAASFEVTPWQDRFYVRTDLDAPRYRVMRIDPAAPQRTAWQEIVAERDDATLQSARVVGGALALTYLHDATSTGELRDLDGTLIRSLALPPLGTTYGVTGRPDDPVAFLEYTSFTEPSIIYRIDTATGDLVEHSRVELAIDVSDWVAEQVWYPSADGTRISMFLIHKRSVTRSTPSPTVLWGYGGFGDSITPEFSPSRAVWVDAGGVYALPNLRGGGEYGEPWHRAGMARAKQHTIDDVIAAAQYLIEQGWTTSEHLGLIGASNGGLVASAAMTQKPSLFSAVVSAVPLSDMVRYVKSGNGPNWLDEYGNPDDPGDFKALYAYSPYHHVVDGTAYPALLVLSSDHDDRVDPMHARKLVAAIQHATASKAPVLLRIQPNSGHRGSALISEQVEEFGAAYGFLRAYLR